VAAFEMIAHSWHCGVPKLSAKYAARIFVANLDSLIDVTKHCDPSGASCSTTSPPTPLNAACM
jgi:N-acetylmuramoyl-L-alanine amidase CwlA